MFKRNNHAKPMPVPKYQIGQRVWCIKDSKAVEVTLYGVQIVKSYDGCVVKYSDSVCSPSDSVYFFCCEDKLFATKEELLASL